MKNLEGHAIPAICVIKAIGWLHIALVTELLHLPAVQSLLAFDKFTTKVLDALLKWVTMPISRAKLNAYAEAIEHIHILNDQRLGKSHFV
jgi:hypothetical protein